MSTILILPKQCMHSLSQPPTCPCCLLVMHSRVTKEVAWPVGSNEIDLDALRGTPTDAGISLPQRSGPKCCSARMHCSQCYMVELTSKCACPQITSLASQRRVFEMLPMCVLESQSECAAKQCCACNLAYVCSDFGLQLLASHCCVSWHAAYLQQKS